MALPLSRTGIERGRTGLLLPAVLALLSGLAGCFGSAEDETWFDIEADPALTRYSRLTVELQDSLGGPRATLFDDSLRSVNRLRRLSAGPYQGEAARIVLQGYRNGKPQYRETRHYEGVTQTVVAVDIFLGPFDSAGTPDPAGPLPSAPVIAARMPDTVVSIRDSIPFWAQFTDVDGDLAGYAFDCGGDGVFRDSTAISGPIALVRKGTRYPESGDYGCDVTVWDRGGRSAHARMAARVELDPPRADAGDDTTVDAGTLILLHARAEDRFGPIVSREWKVGSKPFVPVPQQETVHPAPAEPGTLVCILRVTDSDGLVGEDTLLVTVSGRTSLP